MERYLIGTVVIARDEENRIEACLQSLCNQSVTMYIDVVNDGSVDDTAWIASQYADLVVDLSRHNESWTGRLEFVKVFNTGARARRVCVCVHSWSKGMKGLNYWWPYVAVRAALIGLKHPLGGHYRLKGYFSEISFYEGIKEYVNSFQRKIVFTRRKVLFEGESY